MTVQKIATVRCLGTASEQAPIRRSKAADVLKAAWPRDTLAASVLKAATTPTADFPATERVLTLPNVAPASAALKLFAQGLALDLTGVATVKVPRVDALPVGVFYPAYTLTQFPLRGNDRGWSSLNLREPAPRL